MKKFLAFFALLAVCSFAAQAQDELSPANVPTTPKEKTNVGPRREALSPNPRINQRKEEMQEKFKNATPEEKERMIKRRQDKTPRKENVNKERTTSDDQNLRNEPWRNFSPEQRARMEKRRQVMANLTPQQKEAVKNEVERHRSEMKKITGFDDMVPTNVAKASH